MINQRAVMTVAWYAYGRKKPYGVGDPLFKFLQKWQNEVFREMVNNLEIANPVTAERYYVVNRSLKGFRKVP